MSRDAVGVLFGAIAVGIHVVPDEVADERKVLADPLDVFVQVIAVVDVDHRVDVAGDAHLGHVTEALHEHVPRAFVLSDVVVYLATVAVQRNVDVGEAGVDAAFEERLVGQHLAVGDHAAEEFLLARVRQRRKQQLGDARLAAGEDDAVVPHVDQLIDVGAHRFLGEVDAGGRITAELTLLVTVPRELQVTEVGHRASLCVFPTRPLPAGSLGADSNGMFS